MLRTQEGGHAGFVALSRPVCWRNPSALCSKARAGRYALLERNVIHQVHIPLDALGQEYIPSRRNRHYVRMFVEGLEGDGVVNLICSFFARVMEGYEILGGEGLFGDRVGVVVLPSSETKQV